MWHDELEVMRGKTRAALSERAWNDAYQSGRNLAIEDALNETLTADARTDDA